MGFIDAVSDLAQQAGMTVPEDTRSARPSASRRRSSGRGRRRSSDVLAKAAESYRRQLKASAARHRLPEGPRPERRDRRALRPRLRARRLARPGERLPELRRSAARGKRPGHRPARRCRRRGEGDDAPTPGSATTASATGSCFRSARCKGAVIGFGGRVLDRGEPKYLNSPETPVFIKGRELYGLFEARTAIRQRGYALVVEGYMDVVALAQSGFGNAVATLGTACTAEHVQKLVRFTDAVVFSFDGDAAGRRAAGRALEASLPHAIDTRSFRFLFLPAEHDPDSYVRELGAEAFEQRVAARGAAVAPDRRPGRRRAGLRHRRRPGALPGQRPAALVGPARGHAEAPAAGRDRLARRRLPPTSWPRSGASAGRRAAGRRGAGGGRRAGATAPRRPVRAGRSASRTTGSPGCCCSKAPGGRTLGAADHAAALRPARLARRGRSASSTAKPRSTAPQPWAALRERIAERALGARRRWPWSTARIRRSSRCSRTCRSSMAQLRTADLKRRDAHAGSRTAGLRIGRVSDARSNGGIILGFRDHGEVTAAPPGPGHPLNEGLLQRPPFPARTATSRRHAAPPGHPATARGGVGPWGFAPREPFVAFALERPETLNSARPCAVLDTGPPEPQAHHRPRNRMTAEESRPDQSRRPAAKPAKAAVPTRPKKQPAKAGREGRRCGAGVGAGQGQGPGGRRARRRRARPTTRRPSRKPPTSTCRRSRPTSRASRSCRGRAPPRPSRCA